MLLSYNQLKIMVSQGVIEHSDEDHINAASIDITLGDTLLVEGAPRIGRPGRVISLRDRDPLPVREVRIPDTGYVLEPGQFILAHSQQVFHFPLNISADYKLKSSMARIGLEHLTAGWIDAGWNGSTLTLELKNVLQNHAILLHAGDRIGQITFFQHEAVDHAHSYAARGRYNGDKTVSGAKR